MVQVGWTAEAVANIEAIRAYLREFNPRAADRISGRLFTAGEGLATLPERGRPIAGGLRQLVAAPYLITYRLERGDVLILRVRHGARRRA